MEIKSAVHLIVSGKVQGVGFRWYVVRSGRSLALIGYAKNLPDGNVEVQVEGNKVDIERFIKKLKQGPALSSVENVEMKWISPSNQLKDFNIRY
ncbi:MAG: acylphosphatase [Candidatus Marinimicrobia bacterium]|nr:acylphosphatase [Candidatus Neomarinimicrobiota bacterium]